MTTITIKPTTAVSTTTSDKKFDLQQAIWKHLKALANKMSLAYVIYNERRALRNVSDEMLADMGMTRAEINQECNRSVLDIPANRK